MYKCKFCGKVFKSEKALFGHIGRCTKNPNYKPTNNLKKYNDTTNKGKPMKCPFCGKIFYGRRALAKHKQEEHPGMKFKLAPGQNNLCRYCGKTFTKQDAITKHERYCNCNPNREIFQGHPCSPETKKKLSEQMKQKHKQGLAYNWAGKRRKHKPSFAEQWLINLLAKEFNWQKDVDYITEEPYHGFYLDFLWPEKKMVIEMDGDQHKNDKTQQDRDKCKDEWLKKEGFHELRIPWGEVQRPDLKQFWIDEIKRFLTNPKNFSLKPYITREQLKEIRHKEVENLKKSGKIDKNGNYSASKLSKDELIARAKIIIKSGVNLKKFGWQKEVENMTGLTRAEIRLVANTVLKGKCYRRDGK